MKSTIITMTLLAGFAFANDKTPVLNKEHANQEKRISEGLANGSLTPTEAARLRAQERESRRDLRQAERSGGTLTPAERANAQRESKQLSRKIYKQKLDGQLPPKP